MYKGRLIIILGALAVLIFIGWFYFSQLRLFSFGKERDSVEYVELEANSLKEKSDKTEEEQDPLLRVDSQEGITVQATILTQNSFDNQIVFEIEINTHSGDLTAYKMEQLAQISFDETVNNKGEFKWKKKKGDSHHVVGYLTWEGEKISDNITLDLKNLKVESRSFHWSAEEINN